MASPDPEYGGPSTSRSRSSSKDDTQSIESQLSSLAVEEEADRSKSFRTNIPYTNNDNKRKNEDDYHFFIPHRSTSEMGIGPVFIPESVLDVVKRDLEESFELTTPKATPIIEDANMSLGGAPGSPVRKLSPFEVLPPEIFGITPLSFYLIYRLTFLQDQIIPHLYSGSTTAQGHKGRNKDLITCLCVSTRIHCATLSTLYKNVAFTQASVFSKFLRHIKKYPYLGTLVRKLDFSRFSSVGLGRSAQMNTVVMDLTATTLLECLELTPYLQEFLSCEHLEKDFSAAIIQKLFCGLPYLSTLDLCAATSKEFNGGMISVINPDNADLPKVLPMQRLGFHECAALPAKVFDTLMPRLPKLTHLDLSRTPVTDATLNLIPQQARLTHLSLLKCLKLTGSGVVEFLTTHPAVKNSLVQLNLYCDPARFRLLHPEDVENLLPRLPASLVSLNLTGAGINSDNIGLVYPLLPQLEELSLGGATLDVKDLNDIVSPDRKSNVKYLDLTGVATATPRTLLFEDDCLLLSTSSKPLQVLEVSEKVVEAMTERPQIYTDMGWTVRTKGRRGWLVRKGSVMTEEELARMQRRSSFGMRRMSNEHDLPEGMNGVCSDDPQDSGRRDWKMGDRYWGARKISCSWGETAGIYAYYGYSKL